MAAGARMSPASPGTAAALALGALLASLLSALPHVLLMALLAFAGGALWLLRAGVGRLVGACLLGFALLLIHAHGRMQARLPAAMAGEEVVLHGQVVSLPQATAQGGQFHFRVAKDAALPEALRGRTLRLGWFERTKGDAGAAPALQVRAGEHWRFRVRLRPVQGLRNPGGFDAERQMLLDDLVGNGDIRALAQAQRVRPGHGIQAWREAMSERISASVPPDSARFVAALALGDTRGLSDADWQALRATGLTHLIAISGFHVGMVGMAAAGLMFAFCHLFPALTRHWPRRFWMLAAALLASFAYLMATGAALPTVRTVLMTGFVAGAVWLRRQGSIAQSLSVAVLAVLLLAPLSVLRPGFWLSFGGVAWLAWCLQSLRQGQLRALLASQWVAALGLLPLTVVFFSQASLAGPVTNLIAVPWWSLLVVPLSILGVVAEMLWPGAGAPIWRLAGAVFAPSWELFEWVSTLPLALFWLPESRWFALPLALLAAFVWLLPRVAMPGRWLAGVLWLPLLFPQVPRPGRGAFEIVQLDVGQGMALLLRTARHDLLYDAGPASMAGFDAGERVVLPALRSLGVRKLDAIILSHADSDHAGGLASVRMAFPEARVIAPPAAGVVGQEDCLAGEHWQRDDVDFMFLHPTAHFPYLRNESSCVLRLQGAFGSALLTGDIGKLMEARLLRQWPEAWLQADVVTAPHHGSDKSSSPAFVEAVAPRLLLVSAGRGNRFGHPRGEVLARWQAQGAQAAISYRQGAVRVRVDAAGLAWQGERQRKPRLWDAAAGEE